MRLLHCLAVADAGRIINPDGLRNQLQGGITQSASWTLMEGVRFGPQGIAGDDWDSYPVMRMTEAPDVEVVLLDRPDEPPLGAGEATVGPASAAIANAIYDAVGVRLRQTPFTPQRVSAGVGRPLTPICLGRLNEYIIAPSFQDVTIPRTWRTVKC